MQFRATLPDAELRRALADQVNAIRAHKLQEQIEYDGRLYDIDAQSVANLTAKVSAIAAGIPIGITVWRDADNEEVEHSEESLVGLAAVVIARNQTIYTASFTLKRAIAEAQDPSTVNLQAGWP